MATLPVAGKNCQLRLVYGTSDPETADPEFALTLGEWRISWRTGRENMTDTQQKGNRSLAGETTAEVTVSGPWSYDPDTFEYGWAIVPETAFILRLYVDEYDTLYFDLPVRVETGELVGAQRTAVSGSLTFVVTGDAVSLLGV